MDTSIGATLTVFATQMLGLSIASERVTEVIKQWLNSRNGPTIPVPNPPPTQLAAAQPTAQAVARQTAGYQFLAFVSGTFVVALAHVDPLQVVSHWGSVRQPWAIIHLPRIVSIVATGLLVSGGSTVWNNILDLLTAAKVNSEQTANSALATTNQPRIAA